MKRRRHTPEQIIRKLREADRLVAEGQEVPEVAKQLEVSEATYHRWRAQYGGLKADDVKRLKELEGENARLKRIVADKELQIEALKELGRGNWWARLAGAALSSTCSRCSGCRSGGRAGWSGSTAAPSVTSRSSPTGTGRCEPSCASSAGRIPVGAIAAPTPCCASRAG
jgi:putative transposase